MTPDTELRDALDDAKPWSRDEAARRTFGRRPPPDPEPHPVVPPYTYRVGLRDPEVGARSRCHTCGEEIIFPLSTWVHRDPERDG